MTASIYHLEEKIIMELLYSSWNPNSFVVMGTFDKYFEFPLPLPHHTQVDVATRKHSPAPGTQACSDWSTFCKKAWKRAGSSLKEPKLRAPGPPTSLRLRLWDICFGKFGHLTELISQPQNQECKTEMEHKRKKGKEKSSTPLEMGKLTWLCLNVMVLSKPCSHMYASSLNGKMSN